jgi:adenylate kinase
MVLFVDERESVERQIRRGSQTREHNEKVRASGVGDFKEERLTDFDENTARRRYRTFKEGTYEALKDLQQIFHYHYINAHGTIEHVQERIVREMRYQSSLELDERTFDRLRTIPISEEIVRHARQDLVERLDDYAENHEQLFAEVSDHILEKFMPIIILHAISGMALINSEDELFHNPLALQILLDIFSERGYHTSIDIKKKNIPSKVNLKTGEIELLKRRIYSFRVRFEGSEIRRG